MYPIGTNALFSHPVNAINICSTFSKRYAVYGISVTSGFSTMTNIYGLHVSGLANKTDGIIISGIDIYVD
jgi:hypothetical protein